MAGAFLLWKREENDNIIYVFSFIEMRYYMYGIGFYDEYFYIWVI